jgi:hypothetical protein
MRIPQKSRAQTNSTPAPIGGLNARDSLASMPPDDAVTLTNFFPTTTTVDLRRGYELWATGLPADVESLMPYRSATASSLFAASGTEFYDVTTKGAVGAAVVTGQTNARWQHINIGTPGGQFLYCVNGEDDAQLYNGTAWQAVNSGSSPISITGVNTNLFIQCNLYKNRLFFVQKESFKVWYLPVNSVGGAAASLDFSSLFKMGGYLMAMATWTIDNAAGVNEYAVFISSEGEIIWYLGSDPSVADNWQIQGICRIGRPVGRRCFLKVGSDIILITADGFFPLSKALLTDRTQLQDAISNKIVNLVNNDVQNYGNNFGWEIVLYPIGNKLIINVPQRENKLQYQYVMNTITDSWCKFSGWNANTFSTIGDDLFFGSNLGYGANTAFVARCDVGNSDNGTYITGEVKTAFQYFGAPAVVKRFTLCRPIFFTAGTLTAALVMNVNFQDTRPTSSPTFSGTSGTAWNTAPWNTFPWGDVQQIKQDWQGISGIGTCGALHMIIKNNATPTQWMSVDYVYETGTVL